MNPLSVSALDHQRFKSLQLYCMFLGYPRSGHSLVGAMLDAHPDMVIAHELDALRYIKAGVGKYELLHLLLRQSERFAEQGNVWSGFSYRVPGQWQGKYRKLLVIGDKKGGASTRSLRGEPALLYRLCRTLNLEVRFIHIVRNPFDTVASMFARRQLGGPALMDNIGLYERLCETNSQLKMDLGDRLIKFRHERVVAEPRTTLAALCRFLGVDAPDDYLDACAGVVGKSPKRTRFTIDWPPPARARMETLIARYPFLRGYGFDE